MDEQITVSLNGKALEKIDSMIDGSRVKNRSEALEALIYRMISREKVKKAFILAGGKGSRMRPFTYEIPKPLIPVQGKPLLQHIFDLLGRYDIRDVIISTGYMGEKIREHFGNGSKFGFDIRYIEEKEPMGTAGALGLARDLLTETFLMFNGDILANLDLNDLIEAHSRNNSLATIALTPVDDPSRYGVAELRGNRIMRFIEKPVNSSSRLINAGIYILEPEVLEYVPEGRSMIELDVFPKLASEGRLCGYPFEGQWFDTGTHEAYENVIKNWKGVR